MFQICEYFAANPILTRMVNDFVKLGVPQMNAIGIVLTLVSR